MRTNIVLDDELVKKAFAVSEARTKKELVHEALRLYVTFKERKDLSELAGQIEFHKDFNHKKLRELRS
jgi:Arc/MetJ family transcription regulator